MKLKTYEDIEIATTNFIGILQQAAQAATLKRHPLSPARNLPYQIKRSIAIKRRARSKWQTTHAPEDQRLFNNASNKLKAALHQLRNASFATYVSFLNATMTPSGNRSNQRQNHEHHSPLFVKI
jgi:hypothetical protein